MGKVYEAEERLSKRRVALKVLHQELARSEQGRRLFLNEMRILAHLEHPNIVRSLASIEVAGELVMVLEYLDGRTPPATQRRGPLALGEPRPSASPPASPRALVAAHGQEPPIVHRDLKPENVMVQSDGAVKVMDFGIAKVIEALNQTNTQSVGTLQYMSPEQIDAHTIDSPQRSSTAWASFYELIRRPPALPVGLAPPAPEPPVHRRAAAAPRRGAPGLPRGVEQLVFQLLEKAPRIGPTWRRTSSIASTPSRPPAPPRRAGAAPRRRHAPPW